MDAIEMKARELLAECARKFGQPEYAYHIGCGGVLDRGDKELISPIITALTPNWQPIETAPKDTVTEVLGWDGHDMLVTYWFQRPSGRAGWYQGEDRYETFFWEPTHWLPLPSPPEVSP